MRTRSRHEYTHGELKHSGSTIRSGLECFPSSPVDAFKTICLACSKFLDLSGPVEPSWTTAKWNPRNGGGATEGMLSERLIAEDGARDERRNEKAAVNMKFEARPERNGTRIRYVRLMMQSPLISRVSAAAPFSILSYLIYCR